MNIQSYGKSVAVLVIGTLFSLVVGLFLSGRVDSATQYVLVLLSELTVLLLSLGVFVFEINTRVYNAVHENSVFSRAGMFALDSNDPVFSEKYNELKHLLGDLSKGRYSLNDLPSVYRDDIESIRALKSGDTLKSMCPVGSLSTAIVEQFTNKSFLAAMNAHYNAAKVGVDVQRIYIFENGSNISDIPEVLDHLKNVKSHMIDVRVIMLDDPRFKDARVLPRDYIIFGSNKVSVGKVGAFSNVDGADVFGGELEVEKYKKKYLDLFRISEPYE